MRTLIYARYSSDRQNSRSTADQVAACRDRAAREGWPVVAVYSDDAISGAAGIESDQRPGFNALLTHVEAGGVDQVLADTSSRIARNQGDSHHIRDLLTFHGVRLFTLAMGEIDAFKGAFTGLIDEQQRRDLAHNIRRGQRGTVAEGRVPAGLAYGYRTANRIDASGRFVRGLREVDRAQAAIVLRIFTAYAAGASPCAIAEALNRAGVAAPRAQTWRATTISGDRQRQNGMLQNRLYKGEIVHNRTRKMTDPRSRRTLIKPNPESEWVAETAEHLRIVGEDLWEAVQLRRASFDGVRMDRARRPKHLLSGLAVCGVCGGGYNVATQSILRCGRYSDGRGCTNGHGIKRERLEQRVLAGLEHQLLHPDVVEAFVLEYHRDFALRSREAARAQASLQKRHAEADAKVARLVRILAEGGGEFAELREALAEAKAERDGLASQIAEVEALNVVPLHPKIAQSYRAEVARLTAALATPEGAAEAAPILRSLVERVVITPAATPRGVDVAVTGRLASVLALATGQTPLKPELTAKMERVKGIGSYSRLAILRV